MYNIFTISKFQGRNPHDNLAGYLKSILITLKCLHDFRNKTKPCLIRNGKVLSLNDKIKFFLINIPIFS